MNKRNKILIGVCIMLIIPLMIVSAKAYEITDYLWLQEYLEKDTFLTDILRSFGWFIHTILSNFLDLAYDGFTAVVKWDIMDIPTVTTVTQNFEKIRTPVIVIGICVVSVARMFDIQKQLKTIYNLMVMMLCMAIFASAFSLMMTVRDASLVESDNILGKSEYTVSEKLLMDNTIDIKKSLDNGSLQKINKNDLKFFRHDLRLDWDDLDEEIIAENSDGTYVTEELSGGLFGVGEVHFYRYKTDWFSVNITLLVSVIVYVLGIFKIGYLLGQLIQERMFGQILMVIGMWDITKMGKIFTSVAKTMLGMVITYFMMLFFSFYCSDVMASESLGNWLAKGVLIFSMGMMIIVGSGFVNETLGVDDGSQFALKSIFMADRLGKLASRPFKFAKRQIDKFDGHGNDGGNGNGDTGNNTGGQGNTVPSSGDDQSPRGDKAYYDSDGNVSSTPKPSGRYNSVMNDINNSSNGVHSNNAHSNGTSSKGTSSNGSPKGGSNDTNANSNINSDKPFNGNSDNGTPSGVAPCNIDTRTPNNRYKSTMNDVNNIKSSNSLSSSIEKGTSSNNSTTNASNTNRTKNLVDRINNNVGNNMHDSKEPNSKEYDSKSLDNNPSYSQRNVEPRGKNKSTLKNVNTHTTSADKQSSNSSQTSSNNNQNKKDTNIAKPKGNYKSILDKINTQTPHKDTGMKARMKNVGMHDYDENDDIGMYDYDQEMLEDEEREDKKKWH